MARAARIARSRESVSTLTPQISLAELEKLEQIYTFREREEVLKFLNEHPFLVPVLLEAPEKIKPFFGEAALYLDINLDPEDDFFDAIVLGVATKYSWEQAMVRREQLVDSWVLSQPLKVRNNLLINVTDSDEV